MKNIPQKKLLILGGTNISLEILREAKKMGLSVYVADYYENSPCKEFADKSFNLDVTDVDAVVRLIDEESIDGAITGYADVLLPYYVEICRKAGIPCYANAESIRVTTYKDLFKQKCREFGIPVVEEYSVEDIKRKEDCFPVIIKPVDNSGARGIYICHDLSRFDEAYAESMSFSKSGNVLIEPLYTGEEATIFYYLHDGEAYLLGIGDRWMYEQGKDVLKLPVGYTFPARNIGNFIKDQDSSIKELFRSLDMKEGMVFIQTFQKNGRYIVYEMGYRLTGSIEHHLMDAQYSFNHLREILNFAVGNNVDTTHLHTLDPEKCCMANVSLLLKEGMVTEYRGIDNLTELDGVVDFHISHSEGTRIDETKVGRLSQLGIRVLVLAENYDQLLDRMENIKNHLKVLDKDGNDLITRDYNYTSLCQRPS